MQCILIVIIRYLPSSITTFFLFVGGDSFSVGVEALVMVPFCWGSALEAYFLLAEEGFKWCCVGVLCDEEGRGGGVMVDDGGVGVMGLFCSGEAASFINGVLGEA